MKLNRVVFVSITSIYKRTQMAFFCLLWVCFVSACKASPPPSTEIASVASPIALSDFSFDDLEANNQTFEEQIYTVTCHPINQPTLPPIVALGGHSVTIGFDDMLNEQRTLYYTAIHCDAYWNFSDLDQADYLTGFNENTIEEVEYSFNTMVDYVHYEFNFPEDLMQTRLSGNYLIYVYEDGDKDLPILAQRIVLYESKVGVGLSVGAPRMVAEMRTGQELTLSVNYENFNIPNPYDDVVVASLQNGRWDNAIWLEDPTFVRNQQLVYDNSEATTFKGLNEWRNMDLKDMRYVSPEVQSIRRGDEYFEAILHPDKDRAYANHLTLFDLNGGFAIINDQGSRGSVDSDYINVHFKLPFDHAFIGEGVYVFGALSNWQKQKRFKLEYNRDSRAYEGQILIKQGYYDYMYAIFDAHETQADVQRIEGSHRATQNDYTTLVYHRDMLLNYHRVVGYATAKSI